MPHLLGIVAEYDPISELGIPVIEDCAQAIGARYDDSSYVGSKGMISIYSYYPTKMMAASKGGMIQTNDKDAYLKLCDLMRYDGRDKHGEAYNLSMNNIEASIGTEQLKKLPDFIEMRKDIANRYNEEFQSLSKAVPLEIKGNSIPYRYILILEGDIDIDEIITQFHNENIDVRKPVFRPLHMYFSNTNSFQHSTNAQNKYLSITIYPTLTTEEQIFIIDKTTKILGDKA